MTSGFHLLQRFTNPCAGEAAPEISVITCAGTANHRPPRRPQAAGEVEVLTPGDKLRVS